MFEVLYIVRCNTTLSIGFCCVFESLKSFCGFTLQYMYMQSAYTHPIIHIHTPLLLQKLKQGGKKSVDILEMAKSWNCKVVTLTELLKELKRLKPLPKREETSSRVGKGKGEERREKKRK